MVAQDSVVGKSRREGLTELELYAILVYKSNTKRLSTVQFIQIISHNKKNIGYKNNVLRHSQPNHGLQLCITL